MTSRAAERSARYFDRQCFVNIVDVDVNLPFLVFHMFVAGRQLDVTKLFQSVVRIGNQFSNENFFVRVKRFRYDVQQLLRFRLKLKLFRF